MSQPQEPTNSLSDTERLEALYLSGLLDTPPEQAFDRFTTLAHQIIGAPVVLVSLVDENRQFFKSQLGLPEPWATVRETPLSHSFCQHVVNTREPLIIDDARLNPLTKDNLAVTEVGILSYAGVPLRTSDNHILGSFCVINTQPHHWTDSEIQILEALAEMVIREVELRRQAQLLNSQFLALQQTELQRDDLVHMVIHDLRTPLNALLGGLQGLSTLLELDEGQRQMLNISIRGARSLSHLINTILDVSRAEAGLLTLDYKPISPLGILTTALEQVETLSRQKSISISFDLATALPVVMADESKLSRVLVNLLGNAIQHTPANGTIRVSVRANEENVMEWRVSDSGAGIPADELEKIFEKFRQAQATQRSPSSSGLGLTLCKLVVEAHDGEIWAESELGQGSTFCFTLPSESESQATAKSAS
ncbi:sensor histidine kinase ResE [Abditibacteriota bacterium]|nr:sensor histidine kinase ResE [Abditibacteriota bacterium]